MEISIVLEKLFDFYLFVVMETLFNYYLFIVMSVLVFVTLIIELSLIFEYDFGVQTFSEYMIYLIIFMMVKDHEVNSLLDFGVELGLASFYSMYFIFTRRKIIARYWEKYLGKEKELLNKRNLKKLT